MLNIIKKYGIQILPSILIISAFYLFTRSDFDKESKMELKRLRAENDSLAVVNDSIFNEISLYQHDLDSQDSIIALLMDETQTQQEELKELKKDLKTIRVKYEKAKNHSDHFSSADISSYFSDLK
jgi:septal ring factor EnvC (AmiA/AmiB activator)